MKITVLPALLIIYSSLLGAEVYKCVDDDGNVHFTDQKPTSGQAEEVKLEINTYTHVTFDKSIFEVGRKVVMYSAEWCVYCKKARRYFRKNRVPFTEYDIDKYPEARKRYQQLGARGVPVILVGKRRMNGFSEQGFEQLYQR